MKGEAPPLLTSVTDEPDSIKALTKKLGSNGEHMEPQRMGAAYTLARLGKQSSGVPGAGLAAAEALGIGIASEKESMRRAAMYGAGAMGGEVMASGQPTSNRLLQ